MFVERSEDGPLGLWPECMGLLASLDLTATYHDQWDVRSPLGIYNVSLQRIPSRFGTVLDLLAALPVIDPKVPGNQDALIKLLDAYEALLYGLFEHVGDCWTIAKTFFPKDEFTGKETELRKLGKDMELLREPLGLIVNAIKHRQARLSFFQARNAYVTMPGYAVQVPIRPGVIGSDPKVHRKSAGSVMATSFAYDLRRNFCVLYLSGTCLARFIERMIGNTDRSSAESPAISAMGQCDWGLKIGSRIAALPNFVYPQEIRGPSPRVKVSNAGAGNRMLRVELASSVDNEFLTFGQFPGGQIQLLSNYQGDGVTTSFEVP